MCITEHHAMTGMAAVSTLADKIDYDYHCKACLSAKARDCRTLLPWYSISAAYDGCIESSCPATDACHLSFLYRLNVSLVYDWL